ncbi:zinc finger, C2H2 type, partial [Cooperia oncophora]
MTRYHRIASSMDQSYDEVWDVDPYEQDDLVIKDEFDEGRSQNGPICFTEAETELILDRYVESYEIYHHTMTGGSREGVPFRALRDQPPASENAHGSFEQETPAHGKSLQKEHNSQGRAPYKEELRIERDNLILKNELLRKKIMRNECGAAFSTRRGLTIHLNSKHRGTVDVARTAEQESRTPTLKCCLCEGAFKTQEELSQHCGREHTEDSERPQDYTVHRMSFSSSEEYKVGNHIYDRYSQKEWFGRMCEVHCSSFFCRSSGANQKETVYELLCRCNRCGEGRSQGEQRIRITKKVHPYCSAFANVHFNEDDTVSVVACFGHIGHDLDPALLRWTDDQIEYLKLMLQEFSTDYIVHKMRKDHESKDSKLYFITKRDLWNIMAKYNLNPGQRDRDDLTSLRMREEERNPDDGIRFFKMPDDPTGKVIITPLQQKWLEQYGHRGISVDDTHNVTRYALKLATVMVVDERDRGLPAAFLLSGEMTSREVAILFDEVKRVPNFAPRSLVTDEALAFYNGFMLSFPNKMWTISCAGFISCNPGNAKQRSVSRKTYREGIIGAFRNLLRIGDEATFYAKLTEILTHLRVKGCSRLIQYLQREYLGPEIKQWAAFERRGVVTSMFGERWHLRIKQEKLKRKANARVDYVADVLIKAVEELAVEFEIT